MTDFKMKLVTEVGEKMIIQFEEKGNGIQGTGVHNLLCGNCGFAMAREVEQGQVRDIIVRCSMCEKLNDPEDVIPVEDSSVA